MKLGVNNWRQYVRDAASRAGLPRFWRWWMGELAPLVPSASRVAFQRRFKRPVIELRNGEAVFWRPEFDNGAARLAIAEQVSLNGDAAVVLASGRAAVARLAANATGGLAAPKVVIALDPRQVLRKELTLPAAVEENLAQTLAYDLDRHTPFRPEQLYFDAVVLDRDSARKMLRVDWAAALKTIVDDAKRQIEAWGAVPMAVVPGPPTAATRLNLLPETARQPTLQWRRWQVWAPIATVAVFALAAVIVPLAQKRQYAISLNLINAEAGQQAQAADKVRSQLEAMQGEYNYILAKKYGYPSTVHVIDEVTRALPDDTWLTQLEVKTNGRGKDSTRDVYLRGESGNAGKLIALLEDSKLVEQAAPRSPTTKIQGAPGEIFDLGARLRTVALPAPEPVNIATAALPVVPVASQTPATPPASAPVVAPAPAVPAPSAAAPTAARASIPAPTPAPTIAAPPAPDVSSPQAPLSPTTAAGFGPFPTGMTPAPVTVQPRVRAAPGAPVAQPAVPPPAAPAAGALPTGALAPPTPPAASATPGEPSTEVPPAPTMPGVPPAPLPAAPQPAAEQPVPQQPVPQQPVPQQPTPQQPAPQQPDED